jgi:hypothetical protein
MLTQFPIGIVEYDRAELEEYFEKNLHVVLDRGVRMLLRITRPIPYYCVLYWVDGIKNVITYLSEMPEMPVEDEIILRILRGLGHVELFYWKGKRYVGLTPLGEIVRDFVRDERVPQHVKHHSLVISSLPFSTKMRVVYGLFYSHGVSPGGFYAILRYYVFSYDQKTWKRYYDGLTRLALEVLIETVMTRGSSRYGVSETDILTMLIYNYVQQFGGKVAFNDSIFKPLNYELRYIHKDRLTYMAGAWEALAPPYKPLDEALRKYNMMELQTLVKKLDENFMKIESILFCLNDLPIKL